MIMEFSFDVGWMVRKDEDVSDSPPLEEKHGSNLAAAGIATISDVVDKSDGDTITHVNQPRASSDHAHYTMSSADELFQNGKIRPLYSISKLHNSQAVSSSPSPSSNSCSSDSSSPSPSSCSCSCPSPSSSSFPHPPFMSITVLQQLPTVEAVTHHVVDHHNQPHSSIYSATSFSEFPAKNSGIGRGYLQDSHHMSSYPNQFLPAQYPQTSSSSSDYRRRHRPPYLSHEYPCLQSPSLLCATIPRTHPQSPFKYPCHSPEPEYGHYDRPSTDTYGSRPPRRRPQSQNSWATSTTNGSSKSVGRRHRSPYPSVGSSFLGLTTPQQALSPFLTRENPLILSRSVAPRVCSTSIVYRPRPKIFPLFHMSPTPEGTFTPSTKQEAIHPYNDPLWESYLMDKPGFVDDHDDDNDQPKPKHSPRHHRHRHRRHHKWRSFWCIKTPLQTCPRSSPNHHPSRPVLSFLIRCH